LASSAADCVPVLDSEEVPFSPKAAWFESCPALRVPGISRLLLAQNACRAYQARANHEVVGPGRPGPRTFRRPSTPWPKRRRDDRRRGSSPPKRSTRAVEGRGGKAASPLTITRPLCW
jgi:hypothetical protein